VDALDAIAGKVAAGLAGPCAVPEGAALVAACSGGADSIALVAALARLRPRWDLVGVVFVDHGVRDVRAERAAASAAAKEAGLPLTTASVALPGRGNLQAEARALRYRALLDVAPPHAWIATGHTRSDQAETVVQRLLRASGLRGLTGIAPREGRVVRPLLDVSRSATRAAGLAFVDDPSNDTDRFQRNRIRRQAMPTLEALSPGAEVALAAVADHARAELTLLDTLLDAFDLAQVDLRGLPAEILDALIRRRHAREIGGPPPRGGAVAALARSLASGGDPRVTSLGAGVRARLRGGRLSFSADRDPRFRVVAHGPGTYRLHSLHVELLDVSRVSVEREAMGALIIPSAGPLRWPLTIARRPGPGWIEAPLETEPAPGHVPGRGDREWLGAIVEVSDAAGTRLWPRDDPDQPQGVPSSSGARAWIVLRLASAARP